MRWILAGLLAAGIAASMAFTPPNTRVRSDSYDLQPVMDDENGGTTLVICATDSSC